MSMKLPSSFRPTFGRAISANNATKSTTPNLIERWKSFRLKTVTPEDPSDVSETFIDEISVKVCKETIRQSIIDNMRSSRGDVKLLFHIENRSEIKDLIKTLHEAERNLVFLWCAFINRYDLLEFIYECGIDLNYILKEEGLSAIHLSAFIGGIKCVKWLIEKKYDINSKPVNYTPLHCAVSGNAPEIVRLLLQNGAVINDTVVHCAVRANAVECLQILLDKNININILDDCGITPLHIAADHRMSQCMKLILEHPNVDVNVMTRERLMTPLHYAAEGGYVECIKLLLSKNADHSKTNQKTQTPLHLAAKSQSVECIDALLKAGSSIDAKDSDNRTPLHAAVSKALSAFDSVEALLNHNADVNIKDRYGYTPLHIAALNELVQCVDALIIHGADVSSKTRGGVSALSIIARKTPNCLSTLCKKLDDSISLHDPETTTREIYLKLDFRYLLQHSSGGEVGLLKTLIDAGQKGILEHPLCGAFLHTKWLKIRRFYFCRLFLSAIFILLYSAYVLTALSHNCYNASTFSNTTSFDREMCLNNSAVGTLLVESPGTMSALWYVLLMFALCETTRKLMSLAGYYNLKNYFFHLGNIFEWFSITSVFVVSFEYTRSTYTWQNHVAAFAILFSWANLMLMIGQLPVFGTYVAMYTKVSKAFFKLLVAYLCVLIGFTVSFSIIFPITAFQNPFYGILKVLVMMTGGLDVEILEGQDSTLNVTSYIVYILFVLFITIVLMNLVVGIAVHDIQGLHKTAGLSKLVRQTELISFLELALLQSYLPDRIVGFVKRAALISPAAYRVVLYVKPLDPREKQLPKHIMTAAYDIARENIKIKDCSKMQTTHRYIGLGKSNSQEIKAIQKSITYHRTLLDRNEQLLSEILDILKSNKNSSV